MKLANRTAALACVLALAPSRNAGAQPPIAVLLSAADNRPIPYGTVVVGDETPGRFADATGRFMLDPGPHRIHASNIGFWPLDTIVTAGGTSPLVLRLQPIVVDVRSGRSDLNRCTTVAPRGAASQPVLVLLGENVDRYKVLLDQYPFRYHWEEHHYLHLSASARADADSRTGYTPGSDSTTSFDTVSYDSRDWRPYAIGAVVHRQRSSGMVMNLPTLRDLTDSAFQASHCFAFAGATATEIRIDFRPADSIRVPDVSGSVYLDATRYLVRTAVFNLTHLETVNPALARLTVTTRFEELAPLVPMLAAARTEQHIRPDPAIFAPSASGHGQGTSVVGFAHPDEERFTIDDDRMIDHAFLGDTIGSLTAFGKSRTTTENSKLLIATKCTMPPSFEMADIAIFATLGGPATTDASAAATLTALRAMFRMPNGLTLSVYGRAVQSKVAQTLDGQVAFTLDAGGHLGQIATTASSLSPDVDAALIAAVQHADSARALARLHAGRYTLSLSSAPPQAGAHALIFARIEADVLPLARPAALDPDSTQPHLPVGPTFQLVVDENGRAIPGTLLTLTPSSEVVTAAAMQALPALRFRPALAGECPIKQEITLTGASH